MLDNLMILWYSLLDWMKVALLAGCLPTETESVFMPQRQLEAEEERNEE